MKGHLGFPCRPCVPAEAPVLTKVSIGVNNYFRWYAPSSQRPILAWRVIYESTIGTSDATLTLAETMVSGESFFQTGATACNEDFSFRVAALTECGEGEYSNTGYSTPWDDKSPTASLDTASGFMNWPCGRQYLTAFAVGRGGQSSTGGGGGGLVWKTWNWLTRNTLIDSTPSYQITPSQTSVTWNGQTITAFAGSNTEAGGFSGGDGGAYGNPPGQGNTSFSSAGIPYSGTFYWGGSIGGGDPGGPGGTQIYPSPVSPCQRQPARDRNNLLARVSLAGGKVVEDCGTLAAFGSGGVRVPYSSYGSSNQYFTPGYGGGGFDSECPAGPGAVVFYFHN